MNVSAVWYSVDLYFGKLLRSMGMETAEKTWDEMGGWEKTGMVALAVGGVAMFVLMALSAGKVPPQTRKPVAWRPKVYRPTGCPKGWKY
jgi:hypothetical protein